MKKYNSKLQTVVFSHTYDALFTQIHAESSYIASSLYHSMPEKKSVTPLIITQDEEAFIRKALQQIHNLLATRLAAYTTAETRIDGDNYIIEIQMPANRNAATDHLIAHEIERSMVAYTLAAWYEYKQVPTASQQLNVCAASTTTLLHDVRMAYKGYKRPGNYF